MLPYDVFIYKSFSQKNSMVLYADLPSWKRTVIYLQMRVVASTNDRDCPQLETLVSEHPYLEKHSSPRREDVNCWSVRL